MTVKFKSLKVVFGRSNCLTLKQQTLAGLYFLSHLTLFDKLNCRDQWGGGAGKRRGLGPRNDVLITCKEVTQGGGQRIITVFSHSKIIFLDFLEARSEPTEEIRNA